jgi:hypothetical protein
MSYTLRPWKNEYPVIFSGTGSKLLTVREHDCCTFEDAKLIAAAPDLLEALRQFIKDVGDINEAYSDLLDATELAKAAIAKATGEANL